MRYGMTKILICALLIISCGPTVNEQLQAEPVHRSGQSMIHSGAHVYLIDGHEYVIVRYSGTAITHHEGCPATHGDK